VSGLPTLRVLSLGAGRQSTALAILAASGELDRLDAAIFADTGWEPVAVYEHLNRLERDVLKAAGIPLYRVSVGNIRDDALDPARRFASMPLFVRNPDGSEGMVRRQCTSEYKLKPIMRKIRELLGAPAREDGVPGRVPAGRWAEQWIGFSVDESSRALDAKHTRYAVPRYPLLERGLSASDCVALCAAAGFGQVGKSACIGCPYHGNAQWRRMRDTDPASWADAVEFDRAIRKGSARANARGQELRGENYLHRSRVPLDEARIDRVTARELRAAQGDLLDALSAAAVTEAFADDDADVVGCGPHTCRVPGDAVEDDDEIEVAS
jgi:hypothetical protein